jgi:hypothetical protein
MLPILSLSDQPPVRATRACVHACEYLSFVPCPLRIDELSIDVGSRVGSDAEEMGMARCRMIQRGRDGYVQASNVRDEKEMEREIATRKRNGKWRRSTVRQPAGPAARGHGGFPAPPRFAPSSLRNVKTHRMFSGTTTPRLLHQLPCLQEPTEKIIISRLDLKELSSPFQSSEKSATHVRYGCHQEPTEKLIISSFNFKEPASALLIIREAWSVYTTRIHPLVLSSCAQERRRQNALSRLKDSRQVFDACHTSRSRTMRMRVLQNLILACAGDDTSMYTHASLYLSPHRAFVVWALCG